MPIGQPIDGLNLQVIKRFKQQFSDSVKEGDQCHAVDLCNVIDIVSSVASMWQSKKTQTCDDYREIIEFTIFDARNSLCDTKSG